MFVKTVNKLVTVKFFDVTGSHSTIQLDVFKLSVRHLISIRDSGIQQLNKQVIRRYYSYGRMSFRSPPPNIKVASFVI